jgi:hypothetical protein
MMTFVHAVIAAAAIAVPHHSGPGCPRPAVTPAPARIGRRFQVDVPRSFRESKATLLASAHGRTVKLPSVRKSRSVLLGVLTPTAARTLGLRRSGTIETRVLWLEFTGSRAAQTCVDDPAGTAAGTTTASGTPVKPPAKAASPSRATNTTPSGPAPANSPTEPSNGGPDGAPGGGGSTSANDERGLLEWAPPRLTSPKTIVLQSGLDPDYIWLPPNQDAIIKFPPGGIHGAVEIDGGHNVVMIGGSITVPSSANQSDNNSDDTDQAIYIRQSTGTVHIEGIQITGDPNTQFDGIDINAPSASVQLENIRVTNLWGSDTTQHADVVQTWGGVGTLRIDRLSADGDYQGLTIDPDLGPVGPVDIEDVDLTYEAIPSALAPITVGGGYMIWLTKGVTSCSAPAQTTFSNVYVYDESQRVRASNTIWPPSVGTNLPCAGEVSGTTATWNNLAVTGHVTLTAPPSGPFVPVGVAGDSYRPLGYILGS